MHFAFVHSSLSLFSLSFSVLEDLFFVSLDHFIMFLSPSPSFLLGLSQLLELLLLLLSVLLDRFDVSAQLAVANLLLSSLLNERKIVRLLMLLIDTVQLGLPVLSHLLLDLELPHLTLLLLHGFLFSKCQIDNRLLSLLFQFQLFQLRLLPVEFMLLVLFLSLLDLFSLGHLGLFDNLHFSLLELFSPSSSLNLGFLDSACKVLHRNKLIPVLRPSSFRAIELL